MKNVTQKKLVLMVVLIGFCGLYCQGANAVVCNKAEVSVCGGTYRACAGNECEVDENCPIGIKIFPWTKLISGTTKYGTNDGPHICKQLFNCQCDEPTDECYTPQSPYYTTYDEHVANLDYCDPPCE